MHGFVRTVKFGVPYPKCLGPKGVSKPSISKTSKRGLLIALMMEAVPTSETSVNFNVTTWYYIPEDYKLNKVCLILCSS
jgi:hypothetical protein